VTGVLALATSLPASATGAPDILVYSGNDGLNFGFTHFGAAVGLPVQTSTTTLPADLSSYACIVLTLNRTAFSSEATAALSKYVHDGGHLLALADNSVFPSAVTTMNGLSDALGASMSLATQTIDSGFNVTDQIDATSLTAGVSSVGYASTTSVTVSVDGTARSLIRTRADGQAPRTTFMAAQQIGAGTFVLSGDVNVLGDGTPFYTDYDNGTLANNLCLKSLQQYSVVPLYKVDKKNRPGSTVPITIRVNDASGTNSADPALAVKAVSLASGATTVSPVPAPGSTQPNGLFTYVATLTPGGGYQYNVKAVGLAVGTWTLNFTIGDDPVLYSTTFVIR
jgi:hypothetical protein